MIGKGDWGYRGRFSVVWSSMRHRLCSHTQGMDHCHLLLTTAFMKCIISRCERSFLCVFLLEPFFIGHLRCFWAHWHALFNLLGSTHNNMRCLLAKCIIMPHIAADTGLTAEAALQARNERLCGGNGICALYFCHNSVRHTLSTAGLSMLLLVLLISCTRAMVPAPALTTCL